jgi:hypothetical protein
MAESWSIRINQHNGQITFTPDPGGTAGQPLGVNPFDNVTWDNQTNQEIELKSMQPEGLILCPKIPAGGVSDPIFNVPRFFPANPPAPLTSIGYYWVRPGGAPQPAQPDAWIVVIASA